MPYLGEICALLTAVCWTGSSAAFAFASRAVGPNPANQFRLVIALPVLLLLAWASTGTVWPIAAGGERIGWLALSGLIGLVLGDIGFFYALATIGPRVSSVLMASWPVVTVGIEALAGRRPGPLLLVGIALTLLGVAIVLLRNREGSAWQTISRRQWWLGVGGALFGASGQALGFVLAGHGMAAGPDLPNGVDPLLATVVRMATAVVGLQLVLLLRGTPLALRAVFAHPVAMRAASLGAMFGPVAGVWLSMLARRHASDAGLAAALMATTPIFMLPVAWWLYRARIGVAGCIGTALAVLGVGVCLLSR
jgi:drug/metabolite transporter (DMT)-like permease